MSDKMQYRPQISRQTRRRSLDYGRIFPIVGAVKANNGELWEYPLTIRFIK